MLNYNIICKYLFVVWIWLYVDMYVKFMLVYLFLTPFFDDKMQVTLGKINAIPRKIIEYEGGFWVYFYEFNIK